MHSAHGRHHGAQRMKAAIGGAFALNDLASILRNRT
jgi:hypothetical protein